VQVYDVDNTSIVGVSGVFNIVGNLSITSPLGGEQWAVGAAHNITWTSSAG
jgi:hypothetical protein